MRKIFHFGLFAVLLATMVVVSSCGKDNTSDDPTPPSSSTTNEKLNEWMFDYMKSHYLWNDAVKTLKPDLSAPYEDFLEGVLKAVAAQGDVNHDDGHWEDGKRSYFYSNIRRYKLAKSRAVTRGTRETAEGTGIVFMIVSPIETGKEAYLFELMAVSPGSPADKAGFKRGTLITKINGMQITKRNYKDMVTVITPDEAGKTIRITTAEVNSENQLVDQPETTITSASFNDNPVWASKTLTADNGDKVGYLCYESFNLYYDEELMDVFKKFKSDGVKDVILDLRYNGGGHVISSLVLGTMIVGEAKKDQIYSNITYNKTRTDAGERGDEYRIGDGESYPLLTNAMSSPYALGLGRVYVLCTGNTASASELVVNGLRGLDVEVRLIGETTNGKNAGMEPIVNKKMGDGYEYEFAPITFYTVNAKGFKDYSNGFEPDVVIDESEYMFYEWGDTGDPLVGLAMKWINDGVKPSVPSKVRAAGFKKREVLDRIKWGGSLEGMIQLPRAEQVQ